MLKIRLQRVGRKHEPSFRLVLTDSKNSTKSGKYLENLGNYDARRGEKAEFKADRITYWMSKGAQTSPTVHNLLVSKKIVAGKKINVLPLKKPIIKEIAKEVAKDAEMVAESPATPEAPSKVAPVEEVGEEIGAEVVEETPAEKSVA